MKTKIIEYLDEKGIDLKTSFGEELIILNKTDFEEFADGLVKKLNIHIVSVCSLPEGMQPCRHECFGVCQYNGHCNFKKDK